MTSEAMALQSRPSTLTTTRPPPIIPLKCSALAIMLIILTLGPIMLECRQRDEQHHHNNKHHQHEHQQQQQLLQHENHEHVQQQQHQPPPHHGRRNADSLSNLSDYDLPMNGAGAADHNGDGHETALSPSQRRNDGKKGRRRDGSGDYAGDGNGRGGGGGGGGGGRRDGRRHGGGGGGGKRRGRGRKGVQKHGHRRQQQQRQMEDNDISLWIGEKQLQMLSALFFPHSSSSIRIYAIDNGHVLNDIREVSIYKYLIIPSEVNCVNFTWKAGERKYSYHFDRLETMDESILLAPSISIETKGRIPQKEKDFSIFLPCKANSSGTAMFNIGLSIRNGSGRPLPGTPLRLSFKKDCAHRGPDPDCQLKCGTNGFCNHNKVCQCRVGYTGQYCQTAVCIPACMNGGNCTAPFECTCPAGYQGSQCEGGICREKCLNGGKCIQKDKCHCSNGYYGLHCEYSKCVIPCMNGGRCNGPNMCRCPNGLRGNHCEIGLKQRSTCKRPCRHGKCMPNKSCDCDNGFYGRFCNRKFKKHRQI